MSKLNRLYNAEKNSLLSNASEMGGIIYRKYVRVYSGLCLCRYESLTPSTLELHDAAPLQPYKNYVKKHPEVLALLVDQSIPTPEILGSIPSSAILFTIYQLYYKLYGKDKNKEKGAMN